ncbi:hypothetical protein CC117_24175 [Parafrankia colletiae]|uniref:Peptidase M20 dimerisation domain-containing protein n=1 Tax=Parafrankia colletiae TaxID=573497 RepID=A0A1S1QFY0_9ACTN|nr:hypothetical protein CC117_24175 [Parafrankia colletiae]
MLAAIDRQAGRIAALSEAILRDPETGFREVRTAARVEAELRAMGLRPETELAITGVRARLRGRCPGPTVAIIGELDALAVPDHPFAGAATGAAHACGHNAQVAAMIGAGLGLAEVMGDLDGDVVLFAVPAEETIEVGWRLEQRAAGRLEFIIGKPELIRLGAFDDVDLAITSHATVSTPDGPSIEVLGGAGASANGAVTKHVVFRGRAAHSGHEPWAGVDAQKALTVATVAIDAQRETFRDADHVRVHYTISAGGNAISSVPAEARLEIMVRAATVDGLRDASGKVDRALRAGAQALGASVEITTAAGYFPLEADPGGAELAAAAARAAVGAGQVRVHEITGHSGVSTDVADLARVMPVLSVLSGGATPGYGPHSSGFYIADSDRGVIAPAKAMALLTVELLRDGAARARALTAARPRMSRDEYVATRRSLEGAETYPSAPSAPPAGGGAARSRAVAASSTVPVAGSRTTP